MARTAKQRSKHWKKVEADVAAFFGTKRVPLSGSNSGHDTQSDSRSPHFYIETKYRDKHAAVELWKEQLPKAQEEGKPLIVALAQRRQHRQKGCPQFLVLIDPGDIKTIAALLPKARMEQCRKQTGTSKKRRPAR